MSQRKLIIVDARAYSHVIYLLKSIRHYLSISTLQNDLLLGCFFFSYTIYSIRKIKFTFVHHNKMFISYNVFTHMWSRAAICMVIVVKGIKGIFSRKKKSFTLNIRKKCGKQNWFYLNILLFCKMKIYDI